MHGNGKIGIANERNGPERWAQVWRGLGLMSLVQTLLSVRSDLIPILRASVQWVVGLRGGWGWSWEWRWRELPDWSAEANGLGPGSSLPRIRRPSDGMQSTRVKTCLSANVFVHCWFCGPGCGIAGRHYSSLSSPYRAAYQQRKTDEERKSFKVEHALARMGLNGWENQFYELGQALEHLWGSVCSA